MFLWDFFEAISFLFDYYWYRSLLILVLSGYAIGYLLWGYLILFEVSLVSTIIIRFLIKFYFIAENLAKIFLPIITIYIFKRILIWYLCRYFLVNNNKSNKSFLFKNANFYFILSHFNFFFDCFLGSFVCFMRMAKSSLAALFFMPRLDYSIFGRYLERTDMGFISYVSFIHIEVSQTHPVKLAFCELAKSQSGKHTREWIRARNRWSLAYTLINNPLLKKQRKGYLNLQKLIPRVESFEQFLERQVRVMFFKDQNKKKSKSTPCLIDEANYSSNTTPPKVAPRKIFDNRPAENYNYYQNIDSIYVVNQNQ